MNEGDFVELLDDSPLSAQLRKDLRAKLNILDGQDFSQMISGMNFASASQLPDIIQNNPHCKGPKGDQGIQGSQGLSGQAGSVGLQGPKGDIGLTGPQGNVGPKGDKGEHGTNGINATTTSLATTAANGLMSSSDKQKIELNQSSIITVTGTLGRAFWNFPISFPTGSTPIINCVAVKPIGSTATYNAQIYGEPTVSGVFIEVNTIPAGILGILGSIIISQPAPSGTKIHVNAKLP